MLIAIGATTAGAITITAGWAIGVYNTVVKGEENIKGQWADVLSEYQRRADLFENLVKVVKHNAKFEKDTLGHIAEARGAIAPNGNGKGKVSKKDQMAKLVAMDNAMSGFHMQMEAYPELKANNQFNKLMNEISETEDTVRMARGEYNNIVEDFNKYNRSFPAIILTRMWKVKRADLFKNESYSNERPSIDM